MTTLKDDGYLETDDPVVAVCFLDEKIRFERDHTDSLVELVGVSKDRVDVYPPAGLAVDEREYPILIPAKTVAEVWKDADPVKLSALAAATSGRCDNPFPMFDWLTTHTKEDT